MDDASLRGLGSTPFTTADACPAGDGMSTASAKAVCSADLASAAVSTYSVGSEVLTLDQLGGKAAGYLIAAQRYVARYNDHCLSAGTYLIPAKVACAVEGTPWGPWLASFGMSRSVAAVAIGLAGGDVVIINGAMKARDEAAKASGNAAPPKKNGRPLGVTAKDPEATRAAVARRQQECRERKKLGGLSVTSHTNSPSLPPPTSNPYASSTATSRAASLAIIASYFATLVTLPDNDLAAFIERNNA